MADGDGGERGDGGGAGAGGWGQGAGSRGLAGGEGEEKKGEEGGMVGHRLLIKDYPFVANILFPPAQIAQPIPRLERLSLQKH